MKWTAKDMPDQSGRTAVVTGANGGIGFETARALAAKGARVVLACRDERRGEDAERRLNGEGHPGRALFMRLDLADLSSVTGFADAFKASHARLDILVNNAGVMIPAERVTADGFETQMGVNHLGHFALTGLLLPALLASPSPRVVSVSSLVHAMGCIDLDDLNWRKRRYRAWRAYGDSKLANLLFIHELDRRFGEGRTPLRAASAHPGWTATNLQRNCCLGRFNCLCAMAPWQGALPTLHAATSPGVRGGEYFGPDGCLGWTGYPKQRTPCCSARNRRTREGLWEESVRLTGVRYDA
jgi:NAD(P)-dependent dehydrogenase (short-subunit alcohol dehydrogenase family)